MIQLIIELIKEIIVQLSDPITKLNGVGPKLAQTLEKINVRLMMDLLFHLPYRYQDRTRITPIRDLRDHDWAVVEGVIIRQEIRQGRRKQLICYVQDPSHIMRFRFFHFYADLSTSLSEGARVRAFGEVRWISNHFEMAHPEFELLHDNQPIMLDEHLTPIYRTTQGLSQKKLRQLIDSALVLIKNNTIELLPEALIEQYNYPSLVDSLNFLHHPPPNTSVTLLEEGQHPCQLRLALEELLSHHLSFARLRAQTQKKKAQPFKQATDLMTAFLSHLPFEPTPAQHKVMQDIDNDLAKPHPMYRLVQGDVGSGKTLVAVMSCLAVLNGHGQCALMAPTELLAEQLYNNFQRWLSPLNFEVLLLLGKQTAKTKRQVLSKLIEDRPCVVIGTHALFQQDVTFANLQLIIIDEQHRFGVKQRLALQQKGFNGTHWPHQLIMTATPIPRTLAMTQYASLDISIIDQLPPGRTPIQTAVIDNGKREQVILRLKSAFEQKKQAYWVCTLIEESESLQCQAAEDTFALLEKQLAPHQIGLVHGRMKAKEKQATMQAFLAHELDLLVATTVIEVGVDVANASLMIIENAERLGLSQLHQLRGRVGRGSQQSHCLLLYQSPLSQQSQQRLQAIRSTTDGFIIAEEDLKLRGSGEIIGTKQTGLIQMRVANFKQHHQLMSLMPTLSKKIHQNYPTLIPKLIQRWLADGEKYTES